MLREALNLKDVPHYSTISGEKAERGGFEEVAGGEWKTAGRPVRSLGNRFYWFKRR